MGLGRTVKCQFCKESVPFSEKETLTIVVKVSESTGKAKNLYYHTENCYPNHVEKEAFNLKEREQKDALTATVKKIYNLQFNPHPRWWEYIADLREGTNRYQKFWKKKYKQGVPFDVIREAFLLSVQDIDWARMSKQFKSLEQEMHYGLVVMQSKINDAFRKMKTREQQEKRNEAMEQVLLEDMRDNREVSFNKKQQENRDFSYLLGND